MTLLTAPFAWREFRQLRLSDFALGTLYGTGFTIGNVPLWFLPCLAVALVMAMATLRLTTGLSTQGLLAQKRLVQEILWVGTVLGLLVVGSALMSLMLPGQHRVVGWGSWAVSGGFWSVDVAFVAAAYLMIGSGFFAWLRRHEYVDTVAQSSRRSLWLLGISLAGLGGVALAYCSGVRTDLNFRQYSSLPWATLAALAGVAAIVASSMWIDSVSALTSSWRKSIKWLATPLKWVGQSSLVVLGFHSYAMYTLGKMATRLLGDQVWVWAAVLVAAVALCVIADRWVIRRLLWLNKLFYPKF